MKKIKNSKKGFSLIELLVVVAIIGILAAVGIVAYSGYTASAQENAARNNHSTIVKFISAEITKCQTGVDDNMVVVQANGDLYAVGSERACDDNSGAGSAGTAITTFADHFKGKNFRNPFSAGVFATELGSSADAGTCPITDEGCTEIADGGSDSLEITTCVEQTGTACSEELSDIVQLR